MSRSLEETKKLIDSISPSFCAAKWYNVSIWLGNGRTASCHHPLAHHIPRMELQNNPSALHNTEFKKTARKEMLEGTRPKECGYCWRVEDAAKGKKDVYSDRVYQSHRYTTDEIVKIKDKPWDHNVIPKTVELAFDNLCNLACSYCNAEFSSTWARDINKNGPYKGMETKGGHTFANNGSHAMPFGHKNEDNEFIKKFFEWFPSIRGGLQELRVSGGEPARSPSFWKLLEMCNNDNFDFAVNSNLIMPEDRLNTLIESAKKFKAFDIYTSAEAFGKNQEFVRDGFDWKIWERNILKLLKAPQIRAVHVMMTLSALSVWTTDKFLEKIIKWRKKARTKEMLYMSVNILRFPSFQSMNILPQEVKDKLAYNIEKVLIPSKPWMHEWEINHYNRLLVYLRNVDKSYEDQDTYENKANDFKNFTVQYARRREKPIDKFMPVEFNDWFNTI